MSNDTTPYSIRLSDKAESKLQAAGISVQLHVQNLVNNSVLDKAEIEKLIKIKKAEIAFLEKIKSAELISKGIAINTEERKALKNAKAIIKEKGEDKFLGQRRSFNNRFGKNYNSAVFKQLLTQV